MTTFNVDAGVQGRFQLTATKENGESRQLTDWFDNVVLDAGLRRMAEGSFITGVCVGSGSSEPTFTQTGLDTFVARTTTVQAQSSGRQVTDGDYYWWARITYRFAQGAAQGNLSEIGVGWANDALFNRTLIKDSNGNPTTIVILQDEFLDVNFEYRVYPKMTDTTKVIKYQERINGELVDISNHTVTIRPLMDSNDVWINSSGTNSTNRAVTITSATVYTGALNNILTSPGGTALSGGSLSQNAADPALLNRMGSLFFDLNNGNGVHSSVVVRTSIGSYKFSYDPTITKTANYQHWHNFGITWTRYTGA